MQFNSLLPLLKLSEVIPSPYENEENVVYLQHSNELPWYGQLVIRSDSLEWSGRILRDGNAVFYSFWPRKDVPEIPFKYQEQGPADVTGVFFLKDLPNGKCEVHERDIITFVAFFPVWRRKIRKISLNFHFHDTHAVGSADRGKR